MPVSAIDEGSGTATGVRPSREPFWSQRLWLFASPWLKLKVCGRPESAIAAEESNNKNAARGMKRFRCLVILYLPISTVALFCAAYRNHCVTNISACGMPNSPSKTQRLCKEKPLFDQNIAHPVEQRRLFPIPGGSATRQRIESNRVRPRPREARTARFQGFPSAGPTVPCTEPGRSGGDATLRGLCRPPNRAW